MIPQPQRKRRRPADDVRRLADLAQQITTALWRLRVRNEAGTEDDYIPFPSDRDYVASLREQFGPGRWRVRLVRKPGRSTSAERARLGIGTQGFELVTVPPAPAGVALSPAPASGDDGARVRRIDGEPIEDEAVQKELREAARVDAECAKLEAEARLKKLRGGLAGNPERNAGDAFSAMLQQQSELFRELLRQGEAREARLMAELQALRDRPAPAALPAVRDAEPAAGLEGLKGSLALVREVLAVADQFRGDAGGGEPVGDEDSMAGGIVRVLREARGLLGALPATRGEGVATPSQESSSNGAAPQSAPAAAAPRGPRPPGAAATQRHRVERFLAQLLEETEVGSDPGTVAETLGDGIGLLPLPVRTALDRGDWRAAWQACAPFIGAAKWNDIDAMLAASAAAQAWLADFAAACVPIEDDDEETEEPANAEGTAD